MRGMWIEENPGGSVDPVLLQVSMVVLLRSYLATSEVAPLSSTEQLQPPVHHGDLQEDRPHNIRKKKREKELEGDGKRDSHSSVVGTETKQRVREMKCAVYSRWQGMDLKYEG